MATTVTIQPNGVYYKNNGSSKWENAQRLWDGNESTAPTSRSGQIVLTLDFSWLPQGARITQVTARYIYKRKDSDMGSCVLCCTDSDRYSIPDVHAVKFINLPVGTYNVTEQHAAAQALTPDESALFLNSKYQLLTADSGSLSVLYEIYLDVTYEESQIDIYIGGSQAKEVYVGTQKASAVYLGDKKIL